MRLRPAIPLDRYLEEPELGARPRRRARRAARQERRDQRRQNRQDRRLDRREGRQERRLQRVQQRRGRVQRRLESAPARRPQARPGPRLEPAPGAPQGPGVWPEVWDAVDAWSETLEPAWDEESWDDLDLDDEAWDDHGADFEGRARTRRSNAETVGGAWGPLVGMGRKLRIQAATGHRAAVISLRPGLFLVAEVPEAATRAEFGAVPILAPLMVTAARRALSTPDGERRGPLSALFRRRRSEPVRQVEVHEPDGLPGPVEPDYALVPAPNVGWADDATVAAAYGCACGPRRR